MSPGSPGGVMGGIGGAGLSANQRPGSQEGWVAGEEGASRRSPLPSTLLPCPRGELRTHRDPIRRPVPRGGGDPDLAGVLQNESRGDLRGGVGGQVLGRVGPEAQAGAGRRGRRGGRGPSATAPPPSTPPGAAPTPPPPPPPPPPATATATQRPRWKVCAPLAAEPAPTRAAGGGGGGQEGRGRSRSGRRGPAALTEVRRGARVPTRTLCPSCVAPARCGGRLLRGMPPARPHCPHLLLLLLACQPQASSAQVMDFLFEKWKLYGDQCLYNLSLLPPPTELVCNRTFDKYSCWPDTPPNTTANMSCPWYLPWHHKVQHRLVFKKCGPDGQWVRGPRGQSWRNASQCQLDDQEIEVQKEVAKMYSSFQVMYTVGYSLSLGALLLALVVLLGLSKLRCTRNYIHANLFASFVLKAGSVLVIDALLKTRYSQKIGDDLSVSVWLSDGAVAGCRVAAVFMQYGVVANSCWLLVEGVYLHSLLGRATFPERSFFPLYLAVGWGAPVLFVVPWAVVKCLFENIQCWTSNDNMGFWWILRLPVFLAILINFFIFIRVLLILMAKLRARQMRYSDYKFRLAKSTLTLIPLLGVHEVVFAFVTDEHAQGTLRSAKLFFDLFLSSFQGLLVAVLYCFLNKEVQSELLRRWQRWRVGKWLREERPPSRHPDPGRPAGGAPSEKLLLSGSRDVAAQDPSADTGLVGSPPGVAASPFESPQEPPGAPVGAGLRC